jgi:ubiquinone/menaquinone biosynthesis C-methylase UbiE
MARLAAMGLSRWRDVWRRFSGRGAYPHELAFVLTIPLRRLIQPPRTFVRRLHLRADARVLEIGPGPGYFSAEVARAVPRGRLVLFDLQREMLVKARRRLARAGTANVAFAQGDGSRLPFRSCAFDLAFLVAVLGEVPDRAGCLASLHRVLRPGGIVSITETVGDPDALSQDEAKSLAESKGFDFVEVFLDRAGFTANFRARERDRGRMPEAR